MSKTGLDGNTNTNTPPQFSTIPTKSSVVMELLV